MDKQILQSCKKMDRNAQRKVYDALYPKLHFICRRYLKSEEDIEEAMADAFFTIFSKINQLNDLDAFYAWSRKIMVNQCLAYLKKKVDFETYIDDNQKEIAYVNADYANTLNEQDLMGFLDKIPEGCKTIFNLFVVEGFSHKEIAAELNISVGTSKSQLNVAKTKLQGLVNMYYYSKAN
ncbi:RNA polymerase sigma factor [Moheibacter sediminis]|uniref:RNA polymerase sigma-70 factor, ECF subfamily n=1 Tax=Moheibacter sediminis TaxID=1434700 RepID=A0A1W1ZPX8_9FLAO|nr:RNA polymerase sigma factor [Moheibacter sediminis]SMC50111.1 RNA polymerase sigma-70 factor, ECF subfamily [Moheibacter sediminis]